jgi:hypothetical protein
MIKRYEHTQVGYVIIVAIVAVMGFLGYLLATAGINWIAIGVLVIIAIVLALFHSLTVVIGEDELEARFGRGMIRRRIKLDEIESCKAVTIPWYYGWGIRATPQGMLFRVSGFHAVDVRLRTGSTFRIGTDAPQELEQAINQAISSR